MPNVRLARRLKGLLLACSLVLGGCTGDRSLSETARFDANAGGDRDGLILVGLRVAREPVRRNWFLGEINDHPVYHVLFRSITPEGKFGRTIRQVNICESSRVFFNGALSDCVPSRMQYKLIQVPAGQYTLNSINYQATRTIYITDYASPPSPPNVIGGGSWRPGDPVRNPAASFVVKPGEIVYVGDLNFAYRSVNAVVSVTRDAAAAQRALAAYPNVRGTVVYRSVAGEGVSQVMPTSGEVGNELTQ